MNLELLNLLSRPDASPEHALGELLRLEGIPGAAERLEVDREDVREWVRAEGQEVWQSRPHALHSLCIGATGVVIEDGYMGRPNAALPLSESRGYMLGVLEVHGVAAWARVQPGEWRRVAKEQLGESWPSDGKACKALAQQHVRTLHGLDVSEDEADAVMVGRWWIWTGGLARHGEG